MTSRCLVAIAVVGMLRPDVVSGQIVIPFPPPGPYSPADSSLRLLVTPKDAEVYVDGYYAGMVDEFDGTFQRLRVVPGPHDITLYKDGYHSFTQKVYLAPDSTFKIRQQMERLGANETQEPRPVAPPPPPGVAPPPSGRGAPRTPPARRAPTAPPPAEPPAQGAQATTTRGTLTIKIQPTDAEMLIDGEPWHASADSFTIEVKPGSHSVQVRKAGYADYLSEVDVKSGETTTLNVTLRKK